jgi:hypothetical protein
MSEIPAKQARDILDNRKEWNLEMWYAKFKTKLFNGIQDAALKGYDCIRITEDEWGKFESGEEFLKSRLITLGYKVKVINNCMVVSW